MKLVSNTCDLEDADPKMLKPFSPSDEKRVRGLCYVASISGREFLYEHSSYMREAIPDPRQEVKWAFESSEESDKLNVLLGEVTLPDSTSNNRVHMTRLWIAHISHVLETLCDYDALQGIFAMILVMIYAVNEPDDTKREKLLLEFKSILTNVAQEENANPALAEIEPIFDLILNTFCNSTNKTKERH